MPKFQRPFVWKQGDLHQLLESVLHGFPIGASLVWDTEEDIETTRRVGPVEIGPSPGGPVGYLLDGQQRVSALVGTLQLPEDADPIADELDWRVYCDLESREFRRVTDGQPLLPQYFPVRSLLDTAGFFAACRRIFGRRRTGAGLRSPTGIRRR